MKIAEIVLVEGLNSRGSWVTSTIKKSFGMDDYEELLQFGIMNFAKLKIAINRHLEGHTIYRGMTPNSEGMSFYMDPAGPGERPAANTSNTMNILLSNLPSWKKYPPRNKSFICAGHKNLASGYGEAFIMLPFGNPLIVNVGSTDFWYVFKYMPPIADINSTIERFHEKCLNVGVRDGLISKDDANSLLLQNLSTYKDIMVSLHWMLSLYKQGKLDLDSSSGGRYKLDSGVIDPLLRLPSEELPQLEQALDTLFNTNETYTFETTLDKFQETNNEVWFSAPCLAISHYADHVIQDIVDKSK